MPPGTLTALRRLGLGTSASLAIMLLTGVLLERAGGGVFHTMLWFRVSVLLAFVIGALQGLIRRTLRKLAAESDARRVRDVVRLSAVMCAVVAVVAILMETKPSLAAPHEGVADAATTAAPEAFVSRCSSCHGPRGHGDGALAKNLDPHPPDFRDARWQERASDDDVRDVILRGGPARGRSALMPAHATLSPSELDAIVRFIRAEGGVTSHRGSAP